MSGQALPIIPKRLVDFGTLATGGTQELILADRVDLVHWRELTMYVRVHSHTLTGTNTVTVTVYPQSWTREDPGIQFIASSAATGVINASTAVPGLIVTTIPVLGANNIAGMARFTAVGNRTGAGAMQVALTIEFAEKDA